MPKFAVKRNVSFKECVLVWDGSKTCTFKAIKDEVPNDINCRFYVNNQSEAMEVDNSAEPMEY